MIDPAQATVAAAAPVGLALLGGAHPAAIFMLGYVLVLAAPGPNLIAVGALAALRGFRSVLPFAFGIGAGTAALALAVYLFAGLAPGGDVLDLAGRLVGAVLLALVSWSVFRSADKMDEGAPAPVSLRTEFPAGLMVGLTNPLTGGFFAAQFLGPMGDAPLGVAFGLVLAIGVLSTSKAVVAAALLSQRSIRARLAPLFRHLAHVVGFGFVALAIFTAKPVLVMLFGA